MSDQTAEPAKEQVGEMTLLRHLMTSTPSTEETDPSSYWTPTEKAESRIRSIRRLIERGFKAIGDGLFEKGAGKSRVVARPSTMQPLKMPGDAGYNPWEDAFALRLGATLITNGLWAGKYRLGGLVMDYLGRLVDLDSCPECGSGRDGEYRYQVRVLNHNPFAKRWEPAYTYCRICVTTAELEENRQRMLAAAPQSRGGKQWTPR